MVDAAARHRLLAILAADAAGYSRLMASDPVAALAALDAAREVFRSETSAHGGRIVDTAGDSVLAVFDTAAGALDCALAVQRGLRAARQAAVPPPLPFRIGVHLGDVIEKADGSVYGNGVNVAARLQSLAGADEIWLSAALRDALGGGNGWRLHDQGTHAVKNIDEPLHAFRLDEATAGAAPARTPRWRPRRVALWTLAAVSLGGIALSALLSSGAWRGASATHGATAPRAMSVAIAPIAAAAGDARATELAAHLGDDLRAQLTKPGRRNLLSVMVADGAAAPGAPTLQPRPGGARFVLSGTVRANADGHVASVQLFDVVNATQAWSREHPLPNAAEGSAAARRLADQVNAFIFTSEARRVLAAPIAQLSATELVVRAAAIYEGDSTLAGIDQAMPLAERAVQMDPNAVAAINLKAFLLANRYDEEATPDHDRYAREIDQLSARAVAIDNGDPYAWTLRTLALRFGGHWTPALEATDKVRQIDASNSMWVTERAEVLLVLGRPGDALQLLQQEAARVDDDTWAEILRCHAQLLLLQPRAASEACQRAVGRDPKLWSAHLFLASAQAQLGNLEQAKASLAVVERMSPGHTIERLRQYRQWMNPEYQRLADAGYFAGLRKAGLREH